ncbi:glycosyltransferase family 1 protein [Zasmidium cellare ATCC 36951]|uniref:Glycosyltransferase family 1 protein n=1 Tax=Zasmidium cellare ATCC 36951 TaxID=1080233 RepID=A0A6A6D5P7_ZASCE|nr:glycosyltransferase family 1 protein [Zasmidium cellare ATCC 36951]KAF2173690.1 glycosyltransferase family 1 protein [Zasmidium cellare ATCC 36951]
MLKLTTYSCSAPILEICRILHSRGHTIHFACLEGWQKLADPYPFISQVHVVGRDLTPEEDRELYQTFEASGIATHKQRVAGFRGLSLFAKWWPEVFRNVRALCEANRPDFVFADGLDDACVDVARELQLPLASMFPQMHPAVAPAAYIPGLPGYQDKHLTSEHASLVDRMREEILRLQMYHAATDHFAQHAAMRREAGVVAKSANRTAKPDHVHFVHSFFGLETPKDLPPLVRLVGPVLSDSFPPIPAHSALAKFLDRFEDGKVMYVAFGTHVNTNADRFNRLLKGIRGAINAGFIDAVIWATKNIDSTIEEDWLFQDTWIPQRAVLDHPSVCLFLSHCGGSSTMEAVFHGVPVIAMGMYGDQFGHAKRLESAGVAIRLEKNIFTAEELEHAIGTIVTDVQGSFARNVLRLRRIAHANAERKYLAAQTIEEVMYDHELRFESSHSKSEGIQNKIKVTAGRQLRPPHLETADARIPSWMKRTNLDLWLLFPLFLPYLMLTSLLRGNK